MHTDTQALAPLPTPDPVAPEHVFDFLSGNPEFFDQHPELLGRLCIPHDCGPAVSLIERQVGVLRERNHTLQSRLVDLISVARENEALHRRVHELVQDVVSADSTEQVLGLARQHFLEGFRADRVKVVLIDRDEAQIPLFGVEVGDEGSDVCHTIGDGQIDLNTGPEPLIGSGSEREPWFVVSSSDPRLSLCAELFGQQRTRCGDLSDAERQTLFGVAAATGSCAVIPLSHDEQVGLIALESDDPQRFTAGKGVMFLDQLGGVLGRRLQGLRRLELAHA